MEEQWWNVSKSIGRLEVTPSRTAQVRVQTIGGHHERRSTRQTLDRQTQIGGGDRYLQGQDHAGRGVIPPKNDRGDKWNFVP